jgi:hypothetical protein
MLQLPQKKNGTVPLYLLEKKQSLILIFHRDVMEINLSAVNVIVLAELKTANTQVVRNDLRSRSWRTISADWKRVFRNFKSHKDQPLGNFRPHKR